MSNKDTNQTVHIGKQICVFIVRDRMQQSQVLRGWLSMGMVVTQPYVSVSKLKKIKTKFLRCTGYLNSIKPIKQDL